MLAENPITKKAQGGLIGGKSHAQGGTLIEAEKGEYIIKKDAVNKIGLENLEKINNLVDVMSNMPSPIGMLIGSNIWTKFAIRKGRKDKKFQEGGLVGGLTPNISNILPTPEAIAPATTQVTVNVSGNLMSSDYVEGELAEQIKEAVRRGTDFGIS